MAPCMAHRQDATVPASLGSCPGASWRGVRPREAPGFSRGVSQQPFVGAERDCLIYESELVAGLASMVTSGARVDPGRRDREHEDWLRVTLLVVKAAVAHQELVASIPLGGPHLGKAFKHGLVG